MRRRRELKRSPIRRSTKPIERYTPVRKRNKKRHSANWQRAHHSIERCEFVKSQPCAVAIAQRNPLTIGGTLNLSTSCEGAVENAHVGVDGMSRKAHYTKIAPLCAGHHRTHRDSLHALGRAAFETRHGISLDVACTRTEELWQASQAAA